VRLPLPLLSSAWMRAAIAPALAFIATATDQNYLYDFWHHLARGRAIAQQGRLIDEDLFTFTVPGRPFEDVNWLPQLLYHHLYTAGDLPLVQLVNSLTVAVTMGLLVYLCRRKSGSLGVGAALGVFAFVGLWQSLTIRPQTFAFLLFVVLYDLLDLAERRLALLLLPPLLLAAWANVHGAFPAGLILIACFLAAAVWDARQRHGWSVWRDRRTLSLALCLAASALATLVNPYGWRAWHFVANTSTVAGGRPIGEWLPPSLDLLAGKFWAASLALLLLAFALPRSRPTPREVFLVLAFLPLACGSVRMVAWWVLATAPVFARLLACNLPASANPPREEQPALAPTAFFAFIVLAVVMSVPGLSRYNPLLGPARRGDRQTHSDLDQVAACLAERGPAGRVFSRFEWGAYLSCAVGPAYPVFMDGRIDIFPDDVWAGYLAVSAARADWEQILEHYQVDYLLLDARYHGDSGLLGLVERSPDWTPTLQAGDARLFCRSKIHHRVTENTKKEKDERTREETPAGSS
jgi:hypothetical protein